MDIKAIKGKHGSVLLLKHDGKEYRFRAPTCNEYIQYIHIKQTDQIAADAYLLVQCSLDNLNYENIPPIIINKALEYFIKLYNSINIEEYKKAKLKGVQNDLLQLIYLISMTYNISPIFLLNAPISQVIEHIVILEQLTGMPFYSDENQNNQESINKSEVHDAFRKAYEKINRLKENDTT